MFRLNRRAAWAYVIVLGAPGAVAFGMALPAVLQHWSYRGWKPEPATVVDLKVTQNQPKGHPDEKPTFVHDFTYEYDAEGTTYAAHWLASGRADGPKRAPPGPAWKVGAVVTVYTNPKDPSRSIVNPVRASPTTHLVFFAGVAFIVGPLVFALVGRRSAN